MSAIVASVTAQLARDVDGDGMTGGNDRRLVELNLASHDTLHFFTQELRQLDCNASDFILRRRHGNNQVVDVRIESSFLGVPLADLLHQFVERVQRIKS